MARWDFPVDRDTRSDPCGRLRERRLLRSPKGFKADKVQRGRALWTPSFVAEQRNIDPRVFQSLPKGSWGYPVSYTELLVLFNLLEALEWPER